MKLWEVQCFGCLLIQRFLMAMASLFTTKDLESSTYRWRRAGEGTMVHIFYQTFQLGPNAGNPDQWKRTEEDQYGRSWEIDAMHLKRFFVDKKQHFPGSVKVVCEQLKTFEKTMEVIKKMDVKAAEYEQFDCFFFAFLTFSEVDGRLHFNDPTLERGLVPLENVLKEVAQLKVAVGKPKIFLIQSDEMSLSREKVLVKGSPFQTSAIKVPTDADRLIIHSIIPQKVVPNGKESFLIQAFVEIMLENFQRTKDDRKGIKKDDLLTLTVDINNKVAKKIDQAKPLRMNDLQVPLVTSTLTKLLDWHMDAETS